MNKTAVLLLCVFPGIAYAQLISMSKDALQQKNANEAYWEVVLQCDSDVQPERMIQQQFENVIWCGKRFTDICHKNKRQAAEQVCGLDYTLRIRRQLQRATVRQAQQQRQVTVSTRPPAVPRQTAQVIEEQKIRERVKLQEELLSINEELLRIQQVLTKNQQQLQLVQIVLINQAN